MSKTNDNVSLFDLLPSSIADDDRMNTATRSVDPPLTEATGLIETPIIKPAVVEQDEEVIDFLAHEFHVDFYRTDLTPDQKKAMTVNTIHWHRRKGTPAAMSETVEELTGLAPELVERPFFLLGRSRLGTDRLTQAPDNFTFELRSQAAVAQSAGVTRNDMAKIALVMKPERCREAVRFQGFPLGSDYGLLGRDLL